MAGEAALNSRHEEERDKARGVGGEGKDDDEVCSD